MIKELEENFAAFLDKRVTDRQKKIKEMEKHPYGPDLEGIAVQEARLSEAEIIRKEFKRLMGKGI